MKTITTGDMKGYRVIDEKVSGDAFPIKESVLVTNKKAGAQKYHMSLLENLATSTVNSNSMSVHNLMIDPRALEEKEEALISIGESFQAQETTSIAFIGNSSHKGDNAYGKLFTTVVMIGNFIDIEMDQICGRLGRMGTTLTDGDIVPAEYKAVNFRSDWIARVAQLDQEMSGLRGVKLSPAIETKMKTLEKQLKLTNETFAWHETNIKKLVKADKFLKTNGALAGKYMDEMRKYYLSPDTSNDDDLSDEAEVNRGVQVAELEGDDDNEQGEEDDDEENEDGTDDSEEDKEDREDDDEEESDAEGSD